MAPWLRVIHGKNHAKTQRRWEEAPHNENAVALFMKSIDAGSVNDKQLALSTLRALPETTSLHDIREELEILESIKEGQKAAREGRTRTQDEVEHLFNSWNAK